MRLIESLFTQPKKKEDSNVFIKEVGLISDANISNNDENNISMMDMMIAAQAAARVEKDKQKATEERNAQKSFGGGFKKGFLAASTTSEVVRHKKYNDESMKALIPEKNENPRIKTDDKSLDATTTIPTIRKKEDPKKPLVLEEVQQAMENDPSNSSLNYLRKGGNPNI